MYDQTFQIDLKLSLNTLITFPISETKGSNSNQTENDFIFCFIRTTRSLIETEEEHQQHNFLNSFPFPCKKKNLRNFKVFKTSNSYKKTSMKFDLLKTFASFLLIKFIYIPSINIIPKSTPYEKFFFCQKIWFYLTCENLLLK